ncbi:MAG: glycosyltransferase family 4 protein [Methanobacteriota archaeon]
MRIAHVGVEIVPSEGRAFVGGLVKNVATIAAFQAAHGHAIDIVTTDLRGKGADGSLGRLRTVSTYGRYGSMLFAASFVRGAARELRLEDRGGNVDVVHVHSAYAALGVLGGRMRSIRAPKIFSLYSPNFRALPGHDCNGSRPRRRVARRALASFDAVVVPSDHLRQRALAAGVPEHAIVQVPPALDPSMLGSLPSREEARATLGLPLDRPVVAFLGNFSPWKGIEDLLRAMRAVHRDFPEALLLTAWGEPYAWSGNRRGSVMALVSELGLAGAIRELGIVPDVRTALRAADVLVAPFRCTCKVLDYPLSILEAMSCERAVIGTRVGGVPEILADGARGALVEPRDVGGLAAAIEATLEDPNEARAVGMRAAHWARARFRPEAVSRDLDALYERLGSSPPS